MARVLHKLYEYAVGPALSDDEDSSSYDTNSSEESRMRRRERAREKKLVEEQRKRRGGSSSSSRLESRQASGGNSSTTKNRPSNKTSKRRDESDRRSSSTSSSKHSSRNESGHRRVNSSGGSSSNHHPNRSSSSFMMDGKPDHSKTSTTGRILPSSLKKKNISQRTMDPEDDNHTQVTNDESLSINSDDRSGGVGPSGGLNDYSTMSRYIRRSKSLPKSITDPRVDLLHSVSETDEYNYNGTYFHAAQQPTHPSFLPAKAATSSMPSFDTQDTRGSHTTFQTYDVPTFSYDAQDSRAAYPVGTMSTFDTQDTQGTHTTFQTYDVPTFSYDVQDTRAAYPVGTMSTFDTQDTRRSYHSFHSHDVVGPMSTFDTQDTRNAYPTFHSHGVVGQMSTFDSQDTRVAYQAFHHANDAETMMYASNSNVYNSYEHGATTLPFVSGPSYPSSSTSHGVDTDRAYNSYNTETTSATRESGGLYLSTSHNGIETSSGRRALTYNDRNATGFTDATPPYPSHNGMDSNEVKKTGEILTSTTQVALHPSNYGIDNRGSYTSHNETTVVGAIDENASNAGSFYPAYLANTFDSFESRGYPVHSRGPTGNKSLHQRYPVPDYSSPLDEKQPKYPLPNDPVYSSVVSVSASLSARPMPKKMVGSQSITVIEETGVQLSSVQGDENTVSTILTEFDSNVRGSSATAGGLNQNELNGKRSNQSNCTQQENYDNSVSTSVTDIIDDNVPLITLDPARNLADQEIEKKPFKHNSSRQSADVSPALTETNKFRNTSISQLVETFPVLNEKRKSRLANLSAEVPPVLIEKNTTRTSLPVMSLAASPVAAEKKRYRYDILGHSVDNSPARLSMNSDGQSASLCYTNSEMGSMAYSASDAASKEAKTQTISIPAENSFLTSESDVESANERTETSSITIEDEEKPDPPIERSAFARNAINFLKASPQNPLVRDILKKTLSSPRKKSLPSLDDNASGEAGDLALLTGGTETNKQGSGRFLVKNSPDNVADPALLQFSSPSQSLQDGIYKPTETATSSSSSSFALPNPMRIFSDTTSISVVSSNASEASSLTVDEKGSNICKSENHSLLSPMRAAVVVDNICPYSPGLSKEEHMTMTSSATSIPPSPERTTVVPRQLPKLPETVTDYDSIKANPPPPPPSLPPPSKSTKSQHIATAKSNVDFQPYLPSKTANDLSHATLKVAPPPPPPPSLPPIKMKVDSSKESVKYNLGSILAKRKTAATSIQTVARIWIYRQLLLYTGSLMNNGFVKTSAINLCIRNKAYELIHRSKISFGGMCLASLFVCVDKIQEWCRRCLLRLPFLKPESQLFVLMGQQRKLRGYGYDASFYAQKISAVQVQKTWRRLLCRRQFWWMLDEDYSACAIQKTWRRFCCRHQLLWMLDEDYSACAIQKTWRRFCCRRQLLWMLEEEYSVCAMQTFSRVALHRMRFRRVRSACVSIQAICRSFIAKRHFQLKLAFQTDFEGETKLNCDEFSIKPIHSLPQIPDPEVWEDWQAFCESPNSAVSDDATKLSLFLQDAFLDDTKKTLFPKIQKDSKSRPHFETNGNVYSNPQKSKALSLDRKTSVHMKQQKNAGKSAVADEERQRQPYHMQINRAGDRKNFVGNHRNGASLNATHPSISKNHVMPVKTLRAVPLARAPDEKEDTASSFKGNHELSDSAWDKFDDDDEGIGKKNRRIARVPILKQLLPIKNSSRKVSSQKTRSAETKVQYVPPRINLSSTFDAKRSSSVEISSTKGILRNQHRSSRQNTTTTSEEPGLIPHRPLFSASSPKSTFYKRKENDEACEEAF